MAHCPSLAETLRRDGIPYQLLVIGEANSGIEDAIKLAFDAEHRYFADPPKHFDPSDSRMSQESQVRRFGNQPPSEETEYTFSFSHLTPSLPFFIIENDGNLTRHFFCMDKESTYHFALAHLPSFGQARLSSLLSVFPSAESLWSATSSDFRERNVPSKLAERFFAERNGVDLTESLSYCNKLGIQFVHRGQPEYPELLKQIPDAPIGIFYLGTLPTLEYRIAVVGTRRPSQYGLQVTRSVVHAIAERNIVIISGLAMGIDGTAHRETLRAGGITVAVIASGLDSVYPRFHTGLVKEVVKSGGAIISEFPPGTEALRHHFPIRNRIIAGLAHGVLVTEAPVKSGALLTATLGLEYNRDIFAVPGPVTMETCAGTNNLIRSGANLVASAQDILTFYHLATEKETMQELPFDQLTTTEQQVLKSMSREPTTVDQLTQLCTLESSVVSATLTLLQMKRLIESTDPLHFVRIR